VYVAQGNPLIDAKIAKKRRFRTGTSRSVGEGSDRATGADAFPRVVECCVIQFFLVSPPRSRAETGRSGTHPHGSVKACAVRANRDDLYPPHSHSIVPGGFEVTS